MVEVEPTHFWFITRNRIVGDMLRRYIPHRPRCSKSVVARASCFLCTLQSLANLSASDIYTEDWIMPRGVYGRSCSDGCAAHSIRENSI
jgi:hypothetical protein